jgi:hypothetical protein
MKQLLYDMFGRTHRSHMRDILSWVTVVPKSSFTAVQDAEIEALYLSYGSVRRDEGPIKSDRRRAGGNGDGDATAAAAASAAAAGVASDVITVRDFCKRMLSHGHDLSDIDNMLRTMLDGDKGTTTRGAARSSGRAGHSVMSAGERSAPSTSAPLKSYVDDGEREITLAQFKLLYSGVWDTTLTSSKRRRAGR